MGELARRLLDNFQSAMETRPKSRSQCLAEVEQAVDQLDVSETGRELRLLVKSSHGCPVKERHRYQDAAARLVEEEAFQDEEEFLQARNREAADKAWVQAEKCRSDAQERAGKLRTSKEGFTAAISAFRAAKEAFLADNQVLQQRRRALDQSTQAKLREAPATSLWQHFDLCLVRGNRLQGPAAAVSGGVGVPGVPGTSDSSSMAAGFASKARDETVSALLAWGEVALEDSLKTAALSSLKLPAEARGSFDKAVLEQLHGALTRLLEALGQTGNGRMPESPVRQALPTAEAEQLAVEEARVSEEAAASAFAQAREAQRTSAHALRLSELELRWAQGAEGAALECLQEQEQELRQFERELKAANEALNQFRHGPMASLKADVLLYRAVCGMRLLQLWWDVTLHDCVAEDPHEEQAGPPEVPCAMGTFSVSVKVVAAEFEGSEAEDHVTQVRRNGKVWMSLGTAQPAGGTNDAAADAEAPLPPIGGLCRCFGRAAAHGVDMAVASWRLGASRAERRLFGLGSTEAMDAGQRQELCRLAVQGGGSLPAQVQARHLALLIDVHLARSWWEERQQMLALGVECEEAASSEETIRATRRQERGARVWQIAVSAMAALPDAELDLIGQAAVAEAQLVLSPISMARAVLHLAPSRRRQLMEILIHEGVLEESSASRLFRALTALDSMLGTDVLDALLIGMDTVCAGVSWSANALDSIGKLGSSTLSSVGALGSWSYQAICSEGAELGPCEAEEPSAGSDSLPSELCAQEPSQPVPGPSSSPRRSAAPADPKDFL
ncbi:hypothetical protein AK812_SmicGene1065 [Symbiodinium microadriaticum]|uniref:Uncharacterized protein n=1 Tax=Symbiodinium microadriaticum TaxID=2951 RepID=A0A1Q9F528_SYMMI|nr:hypothetical protein AK812_SmicGene1065 [Symbiodinium microadriaticum]